MLLTQSSPLPNLLSRDNPPDSRRHLIYHLSHITTIVVPTFIYFLIVLIFGVTSFAILVISPLTFSAAIQIHQICTFSDIFSLTSTRLSHYRHFLDRFATFHQFPSILAELLCHFVRWHRCSERLQWSRQILQSTSQTSDNALADGWRC